MSHFQSRFIAQRRGLLLAGAVAPLAACAQTQAAAPANASPLTGRWVYRSFIDSPDAAESFEKLRLAVATFDLQAQAGGAFTGVATTERWRLQLAGQVDANGRVTMRATQGDASTAGWHYEYIGWLTPHWRQATQPRATFVGTVLRVADHDNLRGGISKGGLTYSFVAVKS